MSIKIIVFSIFYVLDYEKKIIICHSSRQIIEMFIDENGIKKKLCRSVEQQSIDIYSIAFIICHKIIKNMSYIL
jgi:hypothetical protein